MRRLFWLWSIVVGLACGSLPALGAHIYWTTGFGQSVERANLDGTGRETIVSGSNVTIGITVDTEEEKVYWTGGQSRGIRRANLDGSGVELLVRPVGDPHGIALDTSTGMMYWAEGSTTRKIMRANLSGTWSQTVLTLGAGYADGIALDAAHEYLYWTNPPIGAIYRSHVDGTDVTQILTTGISPIGITLDLNRGKIYWTENGQYNRSVRRANLDGTGIEDLVATGLWNPLGIALDIGAGKVYWADHGQGKIQRANLDGTQVEDVLTGLINPTFIALDVPIPEPATLWLTGLGIWLVRGAQTRRRNGPASS